MLLALLLHLLIFHLLTARDAPARKDTNFVVRQIEKCPNVGYYFKRETAPNSVGPGECYLCFCQRDKTAICWKRENRRCDKLSFNHREIGSPDARKRRSPGFADFFFREASKDFFNKNSKPQCTPFESSFSDDCPPADWCIGCTVCDCNADGKWDCHVLSYCPDEKKQKQKKPKRGGGRRRYGRKPGHKQKQLATKINEKAKPKPVKNNKPPTKTNNKVTAILKRGSNNKTQPHVRIIRRTIARRILSHTTGKKRTPIRYTRISSGKSETTKKYIKKNVVTHKPVQINPTKHNLEMILAKKLMQKVMGKLRKTVSSEMKNMSLIALDVARREQMKNLKKPVGKQNGKPNQAKNPKTNKTNSPQKRPSPGKSQAKKPIYKPTGKPSKAPNNYIRNKRELNTAVVSLIPMNATKEYDETLNITVALPVTRMPNNILVVPVNNDSSHSFVESSTLPDNDYYKYIVGNEDNKTKVNAPLWDIGTTQVNITETVFDLIGAPLTSYVSTEKGFIMSDSTRTITNFTVMGPEMNDLKHSKWTHLKILKEKKINAGSDKHKSIVKLITHSSRNRKLNSKKYNIVKVVHRTSCQQTSCLSMNTTNSTAHKNNSTEDLQNLLKNIMTEINKTNVNSTESSKKRKKKFSFLRYLKKIFNKIFKRHKPGRLSKHHLIETLCENFGPCRVSRRDRLKLNVKLGELDRETARILKSVKIIKGLLKLIELPKSSDTDVSKQDDLNHDIIKLNNIVKGNYSGNLTETQITQVEYIKKNTEQFIVSVRKFAKLLNEIITILTKRDTDVPKKFDLILANKNTKKYNPFQSLRTLLIKYNLVQNSFMKQMYEQLNNFESNVHKKPKVSAVAGVNNSVEIENFSRNIIQNLRKLKRLAQTVSSSGRTKRELSRDDDAIEYLLMLMEYLIKQNHPLDAAPVNDGIDLLIEAIKNAPDIKPIKKKVLEYTPATYYDPTTYLTTVAVVATESTFIEVDNPSDSQKSSSEDSGKMKLEEAEVKLDENKELIDIFDDKDAEENNHYDRRAGNMKMDEVTEMPNYTKLERNIAEPVSFMETTTPMPMDLDLSDRQDSRDDVHIEKTLAIEQNNFDKPTGARAESRAKTRTGGETDTVVGAENDMGAETAGETGYEIENNFDKLIGSKAKSRAKSRARDRARVGTQAEGEAVAGVENEMGVETAGGVGGEIGGEGGGGGGGDGAVVTVSETAAADISDTNENKTEVFTGDIEDELNLSTKASITESESPTTVTTEFYPTQSLKLRTKTRRLNLESYDSDSLDKKSKLEWIEENFGKSVPKDFTDFDENMNTTARVTIKSVTAHPATAHTTEKQDVSNLTKEMAEEADNNKKKAEKLNAEEVMLRKQMDLLNSLDYGTEKGEVFESDSKDVNTDDRYSGDTFPSYFI